MKPRVVLVGDSIRLGYQDEVRERIGERAELLTPEENARDSANVLAHLEPWFIEPAPAIIHFNCGLHDLRRDFGSGVCAVPLESYRANLERILRALREHTSARVIFALTTPVNEAWHHKNKDFDRLEADVRAYNEAATEIAGGHEASINDLHTVVLQTGRDRLLRDDGVHFSPEGYRLIGHAVAECIGRHLAARVS